MCQSSSFLTFKHRNIDKCQRSLYIVFILGGLHSISRNCMLFVITATWKKLYLFCYIYKNKLKDVCVFIFTSTVQQFRACIVIGVNNSCGPGAARFLDNIIAVSAESGVAAFHPNCDIRGEINDTYGIFHHPYHQWAENINLDRFHFLPGNVDIPPTFSIFMNIILN